MMTHIDNRHQTQPMCYARTTRVCVQNFSALCRAVSEFIANTSLNNYLVDESTVVFKCQMPTSQFKYHQIVFKCLQQLGYYVA